jgi:biopolymer transport protein ExbD
MGGAAPTPSGKGGKKPLDAAINLVPFIDLLSCCISFLLITAVWTQLARMDVQQKGPANAGAVDEKPKEPEVNLTLFVDKDGFIFAKSTGESTNIPLKENEYDYAKLLEILNKAKTDYPEKSDIAVKADDAVIYDKIIRTVDTCLAAKFPDVALSDKGAGG